MPKAHALATRWPRRERGFSRSSNGEPARCTDEEYAVFTAQAPLFERMLVTANAHDVDGHLATYARDSTLVFVINDQIIRGWTELHERQRQWWQDGKSDAAYRVVGEPDYQMPAAGVVVQTYLLSSHRTLADGTPSDGRIAVTDIWRKGPDGWRILYAHESFGQR